MKCFWRKADFIASCGIVSFKKLWATERSPVFVVWDICRGDSRIARLFFMLLSVNSDGK